MNDGGPAFPITHVPPTGEWQGMLGTEGMSLRDYFAAAAIPLVRSVFSMDNQEAEHMVALFAYRIADAMLAERAK